MYIPPDHACVVSHDVFGSLPACSNTARGFAKPFPKRQSYNFKFNENGRKFSNRVEKNVGQRENACYKQFLFFPKSFSKDFYYRRIKTRDSLENGKD